ncbi:MAG: PAS domain S-box protein, partial [Flavisolibacter sp.]
MSLSLKTAISLSDSILFDSNPLPAWVVDAENFSILAANRAALAKYQDATDQQQGFLQLLDEHFRISLLNRLGQSRHTPDVNDVYVFIDKQGKKIFADLYAASVFIDGRPCIQFTIIAPNNPKQSDIKEEEYHRYKSYIEYSTDGIYCQEFKEPLYAHLSIEELVDHARKHTYISDCNIAMVRMYGFDTREELKAFLEPQILDFDDPVNIAFLKAFIENGFHIINAPSYEKDKNGNTRYFLNTLVGIIENGYLKRIWGTQKDITEKKITEEKLQLLASLVEETSDVLTASDIDFRPVTWNKAAENVYGISAEQVIGNDLSKYISFTYSNTTRDEVRAIIHEKGEWRGEASFIRPNDQKLVTVLFGFKLRRDENQLPIGYLISASDITERKISESRLEESECRFREMADSSPVMIWMCDESSVTTYTNSKWIEFTGIDITGDPEGWSKLVHPEDLKYASTSYMDAFKNKKEVTIQYRLFNKDGSYRWVHDVSVPRFTNDQFIGYIGSVVDIEDQKKVENQLRYNATIIGNVSDIIVTTDLEYKVRSWNPSAEFYYGIPASEAIGRRMSEMMHFQFPHTTLPGILKDLDTIGEWQGSMSYINKQGEERHFLNTVKGIYDDEKNKIGYLAAGRDVTERVVAEKRLEKSENFYRTLIADSSNGMILLNESGIISFASPAVKKVLGHEVTDLLGKNAFEYVHTDDLLWAAQSFQREVSDNPEVKSIVVRLLKKDGEWLWCMIRGHNMLDNPSINSMVIYFHDDTLRKQANEALKESEKRFRDLIRELQIGVFLTDGAGSIILCNQAFATMLS